MNQAAPSVEVIVAAIQRLEHGADMAEVARELGCSNAQLLVWLGKYGSGRIVRRVLNRDGVYAKRVSYVSECSFHVAADPSLAARETQMLQRLTLATLPVPSGAGK